MCVSSLHLSPLDCAIDCDSGKLPSKSAAIGVWQKDEYDPQLMFLGIETFAESSVRGGLLKRNTFLRTDFPLFLR